MEFIEEQPEDTKHTNSVFKPWFLENDCLLQGDVVNGQLWGKIVTINIGESLIEIGYYS